MKKAGKIIIGAGISTALVLMFKKFFEVAQTSNAIQTNVLSINIKSFNKLTLTIQIFNPTKTSIKIDSISGEIFFNNKSIGVIQYINQVPIAPLTYSKFNDVGIELSPAGEIELLTDIITKKSKSGIFLISGKTYINNIGFPFTKTFKAWG